MGPQGAAAGVFLARARGEDKSSCCPLRGEDKSVRNSVQCCKSNSIRILNIKGLWYANDMMVDVCGGTLECRGGRRIGTASLAGTTGRHHRPTPPANPIYVDTGAKYTPGSNAKTVDAPHVPRQAPKGRHPKSRRM